MGSFYDYVWRKNAALSFRPDSTVRQVEESFFVPMSDTFSVFLGSTGGARLGNYDVFLDGIKAGTVVGYNTHSFVLDTIPFGLFRCGRGYHTLMFRYTGHDPASTDSLLWADFIRLTPRSPAPNLDSPFQLRADSLTTLSLFPDPANQYIDVALRAWQDASSPVTRLPLKWATTGILSISILDLLGKQVLSLQKEGSPSGPLRIPVSGLASGAYTLRVEAGGHILSGPFRIIR